MHRAGACSRTRQWALFQSVRLVCWNDPSSMAHTMIRSGQTMRSEQCVGLRRHLSSIGRRAGLCETRARDGQFEGARRTTDTMSAGVQDAWWQQLRRRRGRVQLHGCHSCSAAWPAEAGVLRSSSQPSVDAHLSRSIGIDIHRLSRAQRSDLSGPQPSAWQHCEMFVRSRS